MLYKIDRGNGEFETRFNNHYPDDDLLTNIGIEIIDLIVIPLTKVGTSKGGGKRSKTKSKRSRRKYRRSKRRSKKRSKRR